MELWQLNLAVEAEEAANLCIVCGHYGHYAVNCPRKLRPQVAAREEPTSIVYRYFLCLMIGFVLGLLVMKGWS